MAYFYSGAEFGRFEQSFFNRAVFWGVLLCCCLLALLGLFFLPGNVSAADNDQCNLAYQDCPPAPAEAEVRRGLYQERQSADVLFFADHYLGTDSFLPALERVGLRVYKAGSWSEFNSLLDVVDFPAAVALNQNQSLGLDLVVAEEYIADGGRMVFTDWTRTSAAAALFGGDYSGDNNQTPVILADPMLSAGIDREIEISNPGWRFWSMGLISAAGAEVLARFPNGDPAILRANEGRTLLLGMLADTLPPMVGERFFVNATELVQGRTAHFQPRLQFTMSSDEKEVDEYFQLEVSAREGDRLVRTMSGSVRLSSSVGRLQVEDPRGVILEEGLWRGRVKLLDCAESLSLQAVGLGMVATSESLTVGGCDTPDYGHLVVRVTDHRGVYRSGVVSVYPVRATTTDLTPLQVAYSNHQGVAVFRDLPAGRYHVRAESGDLQGGQTTQVRASMSNHGRITIRGPQKPLLVVHGILGSTTRPVEQQRYRGKAFIPEMPINMARPDELHFLDPTLAGLVRPVKLQEFMDDYEDEYAVYRVVWDWRYSLDDGYKEYLVPVIEQAMQDTGYDSVDVVAHSMGGLLVRRFMQDTEYNGEIDKFVMIGTPNKGSANTYMIQEGGHPWLIDTVSGSFWGLNTNFYHKTVMREMENQDETPDSRLTVKNFIEQRVPALGQLAPTYPFLKDSDDEVNHAACSRNYFLERLNAALDPELGEEEIKARYDANRVRLFVSNEEATIEEINVSEVSSICGAGLYPSGKISRPLISTVFAFVEKQDTGDGTVVARQAAKPFADLPGGWQIVNKGDFGSHAGMFGNDNLREEVFRFLTGRQLAPRVAYVEQPVALEQPAPYLHLSVTGNVQPALVDSAGSKAGVAPQTLELHEDLGEVVYSSHSSGAHLSVDGLAEDVYTVKLHGWENSSYRVDIEFFHEDREFSTSVAGFHTTDVTSFTLDLRSQDEAGLVIAPLEMPRSVRTFGQHGYTVVTWEPVADESVARYRVYARSDGDAEYQSIGATTGNSLATAHPWNDSGEEVEWRYIVVAEAAPPVTASSFYEKVVTNRPAVFYVTPESPSTLLVDSGVGRIVVAADVELASAPGATHQNIYIQLASDNAAVHRVASPLAEVAVFELPDGEYTYHYYEDQESAIGHIRLAVINAGQKRVLVLPVNGDMLSPRLSVNGELLRFQLDAEEQRAVPVAASGLTELPDRQDAGVSTVYLEPSQERFYVSTRTRIIPREGGEYGPVEFVLSGASASIERIAASVAEQATFVLPEILGSYFFVPNPLIGQVDVYTPSGRKIMVLPVSAEGKTPYIKIGTGGNPNRVEIDENWRVKSETLPKGEL